jgi:hypothetical protein
MNKAALTGKLEELKKALLDLRVNKITAQSVQNMSKMFVLFSSKYYIFCFFIIFSPHPNFVFSSPFSSYY